MDLDLNTLKTEHSALFAEAVKIGVDEERARVNELNTYTEADPGNEKLSQVVSEAIAGGQAITDISAKLQVAIRDGGTLAGENAAAVETAETVDALTAEDREAMKEAGMTEEEYRASQAYFEKGGK